MESSILKQYPTDPSGLIG